MIRGAAGGERVKIGLRDNGLNESKIVIGEYLPGGITTAWQKVSIPLAAFPRVADWAHMENLNVAVEKQIASGAGSVFVKDIRFERTGPMAVVVDNFNDMSGENGVGGGLRTATGGATIDAAYDPVHRQGATGAGYRITYSGVTNTAWATAATDLIGLDIRAYGHLSLYIRGAVGGEVPNIYLVDKAGRRQSVDIEAYAPLTTAWQQARIPLTAFGTAIDLAHLSALEIVFEWANMQGTVYVDDISFEPFPTHQLYLPLVLRLGPGW